jgi:crotonobetainyl-CoA:carnitine CoA-transferase CaiB-like acyl-CoA transferase
MFVDDKGATFVRFPVPMAGVAATSCAVPAIGEHTDIILGELGLAASEIAQLRQRAVV